MVERVWQASDVTWNRKQANKGVIGVIWAAVNWI
jgi:hypothetical protein